MRYFRIFKKGIRLFPTDSGPNPAVADQTDNVEGSLWVYANKLKGYLDSAIRVFVTEDQTQTLSNKTLTTPDINGGTIDEADVNLGAASDAKKLVVSKETKANLDGLTKEEGSLYYSTDDGNYYGDDGVNLFSLGSKLISKSLLDNTTDNVFTLTASGNESIIVDYSIVRNSTKETGQLIIIQDGTNVSVARTNANIGDSGVILEGDISGSDFRLRYTTTSTGDNATIKYFIKKWNN